MSTVWINAFRGAEKANQILIKGTNVVLPDIQSNRKIREGLIQTLSSLELNPNFNLNHSSAQIWIDI